MTTEEFDCQPGHREPTEYEDDLSIDLDRLHLEGKTHAQRMAKWGKLWAKAHKQKRLAEERTKLIKARLVKEVTFNYRDYGYEKPPPQIQIEAFYHDHPDFISARREEIEKEEIANDLLLAKEAFIQRGFQIGNEKELYKAQYWSPSVDREFQEITDEIHRQFDRNLKEEGE